MKTELVVLLSVLAIPYASGQSPSRADTVKSTCPITAPADTEGDRALKADDAATAESILLKELADPHVSATVYLSLVRAQVELDKVMEALATANRAVSLFPTSATAHVALGEAQYRAAHFEEASAAFNQAITLDPCSPGAHFGAGNVFLLHSTHNQAIKQLALAHRLSPADDKISEALFRQLPSKMRAQGMANLLKSSNGLSTSHHQRIEQEAALAALGADSSLRNLTQPTTVDLIPLYVSGRNLRDYGLKLKSPSASVTVDLDSTVEGIVLTEKDAKKLGVIPAVAGQTTPPYLGYLDSLDIGPLQFGKSAVNVVPQSTLFRDGYSVISLAFFREGLIHIDWNAKHLTVTPYPGPHPSPDAMAADGVVPDTEKTWARVLINRERLLIPAMLEQKSVGFIVPDTSYMLNSVSNAVAEHMYHKKQNTVNVEGVDGGIIRMYEKAEGGAINRTDLFNESGKEQPLRFVDYKVNLRFGGIQHALPSLWNIDLNPFSHVLGTEVSGLVGFRVLQYYYLDFDYRNGLIHMALDQNFQFRALDLQTQ